VNILVRNLSREVTEGELRQLFQQFGSIRSLNIVMDKATGKSKGFGFVEMPDRKEADAAIKALNGRHIHGEKVRVKTTVAKPPKPQRLEKPLQPERPAWRKSRGPKRHS